MYFQYNTIVFYKYTGRLSQDLMNLLWSPGIPIFTENDNRDYFSYGFSWTGIQFGVGSNVECNGHEVATGSDSVQLSHSVVSNFLWPHGPQHTRPPCPSSTPGVYSNSCPLSRWCHPTISSSVVPFSSCLESFPASGSFLMSQFFASGGQSIGISASASVLPMNIQDWFPLGLTGWISLQSKVL